MGKSSLNRNISIVKQFMAERNTALTKEEISKFTGITESYLHSILDLMQAFDIIDKVKRGKYYYFLKGKYDEEQLNSILPPMKAPATPRIRRTPRIRESPEPVILEERKKEKTWQLADRSYKISMKVTAPIYDAMLSIIESGAYINITDYLRDLIRRDLEARGIRLEAMR